MKAWPVAFDGNNYEIALGYQVVKGTYKLDPSKQLMEFDAVSKGERGEDVLVQGIYNLKGDTFEICIAATGKPRPTVFSCKRGSGHRLFVLKRDKSKHTTKVQTRPADRPRHQGWCPPELCCHRADGAGSGYVLEFGVSALECT